MFTICAQTAFKHKIVSPHFTRVTILVFILIFQISTFAEAPLVKTSSACTVSVGSFHLPKETRFKFTGEQGSWMAYSLGKVLQSLDYIDGPASSHEHVKLRVMSVLVLQFFGNDSRSQLIPRDLSLGSSSKESRKLVEYMTDRGWVSKTSAGALRIVNGLGTELLEDLKEIELIQGLNLAGLKEKLQLVELIENIYQETIGAYLVNLTGVKTHYEDFVYLREFQNISTRTGNEEGITADQVRKIFQLPPLNPDAKKTGTGIKIVSALGRIGWITHPTHQGVMLTTKEVIDGKTVTSRHVMGGSGKGSRYYRGSDQLRELIKAFRGILTRQMMVGE